MAFLKGHDVSGGKPLLACGLALAGLVALAVWIIGWWRYPPAVEFDNLKYIQLLRTAVSAERADWVAKVRQAVDQRVSNGEMSPRERAYFDRVFELAGAGKWREAHEVCFRFEEAQLNRRRKAPAAPHQHDDSGD